MLQFNCWAGIEEGEEERRGERAEEGRKAAGGKGVEREERERDRGERERQRDLSHIYICNDNCFVLALSF